VNVEREIGKGNVSGQKAGDRVGHVAGARTKGKRKEMRGKTGASRREKKSGRRKRIRVVIDVAPIPTRMKKKHEEETINQAIGDREDRN